MNDKNKKLAWNEITNLGDFLKNKLPESIHHPKGRNPYAHVALCVKEKFNMSYKDIDDSKFNEVLNFIEYIKKNPS